MADGGLISQFLYEQSDMMASVANILPEEHTGTLLWNTGCGTPFLWPPMQLLGLLGQTLGQHSS